MIKYDIDNSYSFGDLILIEYEDAAYSYINTIDNNFIIPQTSVTVGKLRRIEEDFLDISILWFETIGKFKKGLLIPKKSIVKICKIYEKK